VKNGPTWRDLAAFALSLAIGAVLVIMALDEYHTDGRVSPEEATTLTGLIGVVAGAVAVYLGVRSNGGDH
jgi:hypothetical protein